MARPRGKRRGKYRMTAARRAALKKAQIASAKKRRRQAIVSNVKRGTLSVGGLFAAARLSSYIAKPSTMGKDYNHVKTFMGNRVNQVSGWFNG